MADVHYGIITYPVMDEHIHEIKYRRRSDKKQKWQIFWKLIIL